MKQITVLLAEDHTVVREGFRAGLSLCGERGGEADGDQPHRQRAIAPPVSNREALNATDKHL